MRYVCMNCGKSYNDKNLPIVKEGDGCCTIGSLIEVDYDRPKELEDAYTRLQEGKITISEYFGIYFEE